LLPGQLSGATRPFQLADVNRRQRRPDLRNGGC